MEITEVRVYLRDEAKLKAYATITFDGCFVVHNLRVIDGKNGLFVAMPSKKRKDGSHMDVAHPITAETRKRIEDLVLDEYNKLLANPPAPRQKPADAEAPKPTAAEGEFSTGTVENTTEQEQ